MKKILFIVLMMAGCFSIASSQGQYQQRENFDYFYSSLSSYGEWIEADAGYVWRPSHVGHGWRPYVHGRWIWTHHGWYWVSNEPFGWATFHYGRWQYDNYYGWIWIPGNTWGPAWVEWRYDNDYIGWAPLPPQATFSFNIGISFRNRWAAPIHYWNFVPCRNFTTTRVADYIQPVERTRRFFGNTRSERNIYSNEGRVINAGIDRDFVERKTNSRIRSVDVRERTDGNGDRILRDGNRERVEVFRPRFEDHNRGESSRPADARRAERPIRIDGMTRDRNDREERQNDRAIEQNNRQSTEREMKTRERESREQKREEQQNDRTIEQNNRRSTEREMNTREQQSREQRRDEERIQSRQRTEQERARTYDRGNKRQEQTRPESQQPRSRERQVTQPRERQSEQPRGRQQENTRSREGKKRP